MVDGEPSKALASPPEVRDRARLLFKEDGTKSANADGEMQEVDGVLVGMDKYCVSCCDHNVTSKMIARY